MSNTLVLSNNHQCIVHIPFFYKTYVHCLIFGIFSTKYIVLQSLAVLLSPLLPLESTYLRIDWPNCCQMLTTSRNSASLVCDDIASQPGQSLGAIGVDYVPELVPELVTDVQVSFPTNFLKRHLFSVLRGLKILKHVFEFSGALKGHILAV